MLDHELDEALRSLPSPPMPSDVLERTLRLARVNLAPPPSADRSRLLARLPAHAVPALLVFADAVFAADAYAKMTRFLGG